MAFYSEDSERIDFGNENSGNDGFKFGLGLGLGLGGKFLTKNGWVGEILGGLGRNFVNTDFINVLYPRLGLSIGKRF